MAEQDALLAEYKVCNDIVIASGNRCWQSGSLLLGFALTGAILVFTKTGEPDVVLTFMLMLISILVSIGVFVTLYSFWQFLQREEFRQLLAYQRMCEIEKELGLKVIWDMHVLDQLLDQPKPSEQSLPTRYQRLYSWSKCKYKRPAGWRFLGSLIGVVWVIWVLVPLWLALNFFVLSKILVIVVLVKWLLALVRLVLNFLLSVGLFSPKAFWLLGG